MRHLLLPLLGIATSFCWGTPARADDPELFGILESSIVTTASQTSETASTAPATSTTISSDELRLYGIHTLEEAINFLALGVSSTGGPSAHSTVDFGARGVSLANDRGSHLLILLDGHALNEPFLGALPAGYGIGVSLEMVDHIEVIVGPGSVLYGSNAMLGVLNVVTKNPTSLSPLHVIVETELPVGHRVALLGGVASEWLGESLELTYAFQYWRQYGPDFRLGPQRLGIDPVSLRPVRASREGPETGIWGGRVEESNSAHVPTGLLRLRSGHLDVTLKAGLSRAGQPFGGGDFDDPEGTFTTRDLSLDIKYSRRVTPRLRLAARGYADAVDIRDRFNISAVFGCPYAGVRTCAYETRVVSRWGGVELQAGYDWMGDERFTTLVGLDLRARTVGSKQDAADLDSGRYLLDSSGIIDEQDQTLGAYIQQIWLPVRELVVNVGARLDRDQRFAAVTSPRAAASLGVWPGATLRSIYSEAFRAPNFFQSYYGDPVGAKAGKLDPETVRSVEGSFEQRFGPHRVFFGVFRSWWKDLIELRFLTFEEAERAAEQGLLPLALLNIAHSQHQNVASIDSYGFNLGLEGRFVVERLSYGLHLTEAYSRRVSSNVDEALLPTAPRLTANARIAYDLPEPLPRLALVGYLLAPRLIDRGLSAGFPGLPSAPTQVDLRATLTGNVPFASGLSYRLSVDRVFGNQGPYAIGRVLLATPENPTPELSPLAPLRVTLGLEYALPAP